jgi:hypothetical protein
VAFAQNNTQSNTQSNPATITGHVTDPEGAPVAKAPVQAKNPTTGAVYRGLSSASGDYSLSQVLAGKYELSVNIPCCAYQPYTQSDLTVEAGQTLRFDVHLAEGGSYRTLGDDPNTLAEMIRVRAGVAAAPAPRTADGKPDLSACGRETTTYIRNNPTFCPGPTRS